MNHAAAPQVRVFFGNPLRIDLICALMTALALASPAGEPSADRTLRTWVDSGVLDQLRWPNFSPIRSHVASFYGSASYALAWTRDGAATPQAKAVIGVLQHADAKGLEPDDYDGSRWSARLDLLRPAAAQPAEQDLAAFDLALTISSMRYISDLLIGRVNPKVFCFGLDRDAKKCDLADWERRLVTSADVPGLIQELEPPFPGYRRTEQALQRYIELARVDDGEPLPATKNAVQPGDMYPGIARLSRLLHLLGDLAPELRANSSVYDGLLVDAVKHFQARHGLEPDGRIGQATVQQLNTPLKHRCRQLALTLERWRWIPASFSRPPIIVNIPEFRLHALNDRHETELEMKVVVGGAYRHQTPVFTNDMTHVIFRPYWNVPLSIQRAELVPKITQDSSYLAANDYEIVDARGKPFEGGITAEVVAQLRSGRLAIRQKPGPQNALGFIKFMFPNEYNVYLHGTPAKALFSRSRRDFSHGCIRVERPEELAAWVLRGLPEWTPQRIGDAENGANTLQVNLPHPIPVLILYGTAVVSASGEVHFFDDIYGHDRSLEEVLSHGYPYSGWQPARGL